MAANRVHHQFTREPGERLEQFEHEWLEARIPNVAEYFREADYDDVRYLSDLIELDLEYRWRRFRAASVQPARDDHAFPMFPRLEDYAALIPDRERDRLLIPQLIAEEYRVRTRWGDRPDRQSFIERFPDDPAAIETALDGIDAEFATEEVVLAEEQPSESITDQSTVTFSRKDSSETTEETKEIAAPRELGKYRLETRIGSGGFGEVWKAYDPALKRQVAIKIPRLDKHFSQEDLSSFRREAEKLAALGRVPGIVTVFDYGEIDGQPYIVSDFIEGKSLECRLKSGALTHEESAELIAKVAAALNQAHLKNLVHRDIKPSNILLDAGGKPFIADFGLCVSEEEQLREGHATVGTFAYMSPEQARGGSQFTDGRADIYSLGVVLYRMLTGRLPFVGDTPSDYVDQILHREPRPPRSIDPKIPFELERICLKCLSRQIPDRYTTAGDLARVLKRVGRKRAARSFYFQVGVVIVPVVLLLVLVIPHFRGPVDSPQRPPLEDAVEVVWTPANAQLDTRGHYNDDDRRFEFDTHGPALYRVGECTADQLTLRTRFRIRGNDRIGQGGVFWALGPVLGDDRIDTCCWTIQIGRRYTGGPFVLEVSQHELGPSSGFPRVLGTHFVTRPIPLDEPPFPVFEIETRFTPTEVTQIIVNGDEILSTPLPLNVPLGREWGVLNGTGYGIFGLRGSFVFETFSKS